MYWPIKVAKPERRASSRLQLRLFMVFRPIPEKKEPPAVGFTRDVSAGGLYFYTLKELKEGEEVSLTIHLVSDWAEGGTPPTLDGKGKVLRVERPFRKPGDFQGVAVRFSEKLAVAR